MVTLDPGAATLVERLACDRRLPPGDEFSSAELDPWPPPPPDGPIQERPGPIRLSDAIGDDAAPSWLLPEPMALHDSMVDIRTVLALRTPDSIRVAVIPDLPVPHERAVDRETAMGLRFQIDGARLGVSAEVLPGVGDDDVEGTFVPPGSHGVLMSAGFAIFPEKGLLLIFRLDELNRLLAESGLSQKVGTGSRVTNLRVTVSCSSVERENGAPEVVQIDVAQLPSDIAWVVDP